MEADSTTTSDLDETISYGDSDSDSEPFFVYDEHSSLDSKIFNQ